MTHVGRRAMLSLIVRILSSHWCTVTRVRAPIGHWPLVLVGRLVVTRVGAGVRQTRPQTRHMARRPGLATTGTPSPWGWRHGALGTSALGEHRPEASEFA